MRRSDLRSFALSCCLITTLAFFLPSSAIGLVNGAGPVTDPAGNLEGRTKQLPVSRDATQPSVAMDSQGTGGEEAEANRGVKEESAQGPDTDSGRDEETGGAGCDTDREGKGQDRKSDDTSGVDDGSDGRSTDDGKSTDNDHDCSGTNDDHRPDCGDHDCSKDRNSKDCDQSNDYEHEHDEEHDCDHGQPPGNVSPTAAPQSLSLAEDTPRAVTLSGSDPDNDLLSYRVTAVPNHGALVGNPPQLLYTPVANYHGLDSFTFVANDGKVDSAPATVAITITQVNDPPLAVADVAATAEDTAVITGNVLGNDSDPDGDLLSVTSFSQPPYGTAIYNQDGSFTYTPNPGFVGTDSFNYTISDGQALAGATVTITVTPYAGLPEVTMTVTPTAINLGETATLTWSSRHADTVVIDQGLGPVAANGSLSVAPTGTTLYTITASGLGGTVTAASTVTVSGSGGSLLPTANLDNWPPAVQNGEGGAMLRLNWSTTNADEVSLSKDGQFATHWWPVAANDWNWFDSYGEKSTTYTLTASNAFGIDRSSVTVDDIGYAWSPRADIMAYPQVVQPGESTTLDWYAAYVDGAVIDQGIGEVALTSEAGGIVVTPTQTTTYTITARDSSSLEQATAQVTVYVGSVTPTLNVAADVANVIIGEPVTLSWKSAFAEYCLVEPGFGRMAATGHAVARPSADTVYTVTAVGPGGMATATIPVTVRTPLPEIVWASVSPSVIQPGGSAELAWATTYADEVIIEPGLGSVAGEGSLPVSPAQTTTYTITVSNIYGSVSSTVTVEVSPLGLVFLEPDGINEVVDTMATINWAATIPGARPAAISLYYTSTADYGGNWLPIAADLYANLNTLVWDTTVVPDGSYYIYGLLNDGLNSPLGVFSARPFTVYHPVVDEGKIVPADLAAGDWFGGAVAISNDLAVVGRSGAANVFRRNGAVWEQQATLSPADYQNNNSFGAAVAIAGDLIAVGAPADADLGANSGAVYLFRFAGSSWLPEGKLHAADGAAGDQFGAAVAVAGDHLLVGAPYDDTRSDDGGSAYFFHFSGGEWHQIARLLPQWSGEKSFGRSLALDHDRAVVGSFGQGVWKSTANTILSGAAYVYDFTGSTWQENSRFASYDSFWDTPHPVTDYFGQAVAIAGDTILVGAPGLQLYGTSGSVYVYRYTGTHWQKQAQLASPATLPGDGFGSAFALTNNLAIIGAGDRDEGRGGVYCFAWDGSAWQRQEELAISDPATYDQLGGALAADGGYVIAGAPGQDELGLNAGAAYIFPVTTIDFTVDRELINQGAPVLLNWQTNHADAVSITPGLGAVAARGTITVNPTATTTYTLIASGARGVSSLSRTITVSAQPLPLPTIVAFNADSAAINFGERILLTWSVKDATKLTLDNGIGVVTGLNGVAIFPTQTTTYTLTASGPGGTATATVTVMVSSSPLPAIDAFTATPSSINAGEPVQLAWSVRNVETLTINQGIGDVSGYSSWAVTPQATTTYTLTASGPGGTSTALVTVEVTQPPPPSIDFFSATPGHVTVGGQAWLAWSVHNATTLTLDQGIGDVSGYSGWNVLPQATTTYTLTASGPGGTATAVVTVVAEAVVHPAPEVAISLSPATIIEGGIAALAWSCTGVVDTCVIDQGIGPVALSGSKAVSPGVATIYTVTANGPGGVATAAATLTVQPSITLAVTEPVAGVTVHVPEVIVLGTVSNRFGNETGVTVNGIPGQVVGTEFFANQVPLTEGENLITVKATDINGRTAQATLTVYLDTSIPADWLELHLNPDSGLAPFKTTLTVNPHLSFVPTAPPVISNFGPADVTETRINATEINLEFNVPGVYSIGYETFSPQGQVVSGEVMVNVLDRNTLDALLRSKWENIKAAWVAQDIEGGLGCLAESSQEKFRRILNGIIEKLPGIINDMQDIELIYGTGRYAKFRINRLQDIGGTTVNLTYYLYFIKDQSGIWKVDQF
ncbi:MAG: tandem-95 repeat protein [Desulfobulbaceae bacterium]|nr:tandem-95 repeat protein [Desulfobulbaceae bacterium]